MKTNIKRAPIFTNEGAKASHINPEAQLRRSVMSCLLWEKEFYECGDTISKRIADTIPLVDSKTVAEIAVEAREKMKLRHIPLFIIREMARHKTHKPFVAETLARVIQRADELSEFLAIYWKGTKQPLSAQVKKGLRAAFYKFNEYQLSKYNRDGVVKLRDVLRLVHPSPKDKDQEALWKRLKDGELATPDTWEVALSAGKDKKEVWERLINEGKLGGLAFLRNLRNMEKAKVNEAIIFDGLNKMKTDRILPFRFISAAKYAPQWETQIEPVMLKCLEGKAKLPGKTALVIDGSGSMFGCPISEKSEIDRFEAAAALAILAREVCEECSVIIYSNDAFVIPARRGFALRDALKNKAERSSTNTQNGINKAASTGKAYDRLIVITDEQSHQSVRNPVAGSKAYMINVASNKNGIGYGSFNHIDGWSESVLDYIIASEGINIDR